MADSKEPHRHAPETERLETRPVFARTKSQWIGQDCCRRASHSEWARGLWSVRRRAITWHSRSQKSRSKSKRMFSSRQSDTRAACSAAAGEWNGFRVPFLYASNGTLIWHLDARPAKLISRTLSDFHTPDALAARFADDRSAVASTYLLDTPTEEIERLRPYQRDCILAVEGAILDGKRDMMVAMATGTGKNLSDSRADLPPARIKAGQTHSVPGRP